MKVSGRDLLIVGLGIGILVAFIAFGHSSADSPEHRTDSDAPNGASALPQLAQALGHPVTTLDASFQPDLGMGVMFVLSPTVGFSAEEARRLSDYIRGGGVVVYGAEQGDPQLDFALKVSRVRGFAAGKATSTGPALAGVTTVSGGDTAGPLETLSDQVVLLRTLNGAPIAFEQFVGRGRLVALTDPLPLCNDYLERADNWRLAADLISLAPPSAAIAFDEYHHGVAGQGSPLTGFLSTSWGVATAWAVLVVFFGLLLRGRAFGPRIALPGGGHRSSAEYVTAVGDLLHRSAASEDTGRLLAAAARRALAARYGLITSASFDTALKSRAPDASADLAAAEDELGRGRGDAGLLRAARRLHDLIYPLRSH